ncbi:DNA (cytosine-5-)-methyltransferase [Chitinophaga polysaccharea]|uniref:DNA (cytosine-5-)-methyltransferase n=1 Tax=Chitinophaga polysaccharea TaxID=1293035 RepID=UPI001159C1DF|nr:DNA (cytosine-5-)-methyltransferase [Chitinophaga polysaccharea]
MSEFAELLEGSGLSCKDAAEKYAVSLRTVYRWQKGSSSPNPLIIRDLKEIVRAANMVAPPPVQNPFTFIDLFAGIGGFRKAFESINGTCLFTSEWDKSCRITYQANYACDHPVVGDIREYTNSPEALDRIPRHDFLVGGFPCQPFSLAGVSKKNSLGRAHGFKDKTQGTLFFDLAQIIEHHRPAGFLLENVKNLKSHDKGRTFDIICKTLTEELGYKIDYRVIDGKSWVPQHRERVFIAGFREDVGFKFDDFLIPSTTDGPKLGSILHKPGEMSEDSSPYTIGDGIVAEKYTLSEKLWSYLKGYKEKHTAKGNGFGFSVFGPTDVTRTLSARYHKDGSEILIHQNGMRPRRLTPRECARLMGFDLPNESNFKIPVSDTQAYRQFGNSVVVPAAKAIAEFIRPYLLRVMRANDPQMLIPFDHPETVI